MTVVEKVKTKNNGVYNIERLTDPSDILPILERDRIYAAYAICQLELDRLPYSRWYLAQGATGEALVMHSLGSMESNLWGYGGGLFCMGDPAALDALLSLHPGPRFVQLKAQMEHMEVVKKHFRLRDERPRLLNVKTVENFHPVEGAVTRLGGADVGAINRLYRSAGLLRWPRGFRRELIERGIWYGLYEDGRLVAVSGTQAISPTYRIAFGSYSFTHPKYRSRGFSTLLRSARWRDTLRICPQVVNTIDPTNEASFRVTEKLGADFLRNVIDAPAFRRDLLGVAALVRRIMAKSHAKVDRRMSAT